ncbi:flavin monoamine oxidase family protein [Lignipirellula cremea]|uniref:Tryptophan 2-monooxygenase n=1 Tax=Lignipirellula cremea TaxID=2528010 RepID=A0A518E3I0_9BACT|nr:FAD-dependent oxidoreductase [Lignipirellula cremea]QDU98644.1 protoporphyrinogen oxidase [Lignipirellula cremea]
MKVWKVGIVGGGPGGLMTAYALQKLSNSPMRITLFEASPRLGGKILTPEFSAAPVAYEAGAAEFYDYSIFEEDPLKELIAELGLPIRAMGGPAVVMNHRILSNLDDLQEQFGPATVQAFLEFDRLAKDHMTPREFCHYDDPDGGVRPAEPHRFDGRLAGVVEPDARRYIENLIHSDLAAEPAQTSIAYGLQNYLMNDPAYMHLYGIEGGNERLPQELARRLAASILREHPVQSIALTGERQLRVTAVSQGEPVCQDFDFVVIALPHLHLKSIAFPSERLSQAMQRHFDHYNHPAHYLRITILFDRPFWREAFTDSYWMLDEFGGCCLYDESSRAPGSTQGVLGWLLGGDVAMQMSDWSDERLINAVLEALPRFLAHGREHLLEGRVHRWIGAVNAMPGGMETIDLDRRHQPEPVEHPHLWMVGDYMFDSTLNGVLDSAEYVAAWLAAEMADNKGEDA